MRGFADPVALFLRARRVGWALLLTLALGCALLGRATELAVPMFGTFTTTVFVWPVLATGSTALVLTAATAEWDARSARPMALLDGVTVLATVGLACLGPLVLRPWGWTSALAIFLTLQAVTVVATAVLGDWAWMLAAALGSLTVVNSAFVTERIAAVTDRHWLAFAATSGVVLLLTVLRRMRPAPAG